MAPGVCPRREKGQRGQGERMTVTAAAEHSPHRTWDLLGSKNTHKREPELGHGEGGDSFRGRQLSGLQVRPPKVGQADTPRGLPEGQRGNKKASRTRG